MFVTDASGNITRPIGGSATGTGPGGNTQSNALARATPLSFMLCPSDPYNRIPFSGSGSSLTNQMGDNWARGNYGANASMAYMVNGSRRTSVLAHPDQRRCYGSQRLRCGSTISKTVPATLFFWENFGPASRRSTAAAFGR